MPAPPDTALRGAKRNGAISPPPELAALAPGAPLTSTSTSHGHEHGHGHEHEHADARTPLAPPAKTTSPLARILRPIAFLAGLALLGLLVWRAGPAQIWADLQRMGWGFAGVIGIGFSMHLFDGLGLRCAFGRNRPAGATFWRVFWARVGGEAVSQVTPTATIGGEPVKALLLSPHVEMHDAVAALVVGRTLHGSAAILFLMFGVAASASLLGFTHPFTLGAAAFTVFGGTGMGAAIYLQLRDPVAALSETVAGWEAARRWLERRAESVRAIDKVLALLWRTQRVKLLEGVFWHFLGRLAGVAEVMLILAMIGSPIGVAAGTFVSALTGIANGLFFFIPGQVGVVEGGQALFVQSLGLAAATGVTLGLVRRMRNLTWAAIGLASMALRKGR